LWFGPHDEDGFPAAQASLLEDFQVLFNPTTSPGSLTCSHGGW